MKKKEIGCKLVSKDHVFDLIAESIPYVLIVPITVVVQLALVLVAAHH